MSDKKMEASGQSEQRLIQMAMDFRRAIACGDLQAAEEIGCQLPSSELGRYDSQLNSPLDLAVLSGDPRMVHCLVRLGANINQVDDEMGLTSFYLAINYVSEELLDVLIEAGSDMNQKTTDGSTVMHFAVAAEPFSERPRLKKLEKVIAAGADIQAQDHEGRNALHIAIENGYKEVFGFLMSIGVDHQVVTREGLSLLDFLSAQDQGNHDFNEYVRSILKAKQEQEQLERLFSKQINSYKMEDSPGLEIHTSLGQCPAKVSTRKKSL